MVRLASYIAYAISGLVLIFALDQESYYFGSAALSVLFMGIAFHALDRIIALLSEIRDHVDKARVELHGK